MNIIINSGIRPNCICCGKPLKSWNPLIEKEECVPCIANRISDALMDIVNKQLNKYVPNNTNECGPPLAACENTQIVV